MNPAPDDPTAPLRKAIYWILIAVAVGQLSGRIFAVNSVDFVRLDQRLRKENPKRPTIQRPFLSANDRSRWCTVRALVEHGTYAIDEVIQEPGWDTIDMVKHDGHLYSSKPPLFPTLMAAEYWLIHKVTGTTLGEHPYAIGRFMLITLNVIPFAIYLLVVCGLAERMGGTDFSRLFVAAAAAFATFLSTFGVVINNHLPAAFSAAIALACAFRVYYGGERKLWLLATCGLFAAFTAANELPALTLFGLLSLGMLYKAPKETLIAYVPAALLVAVAALGTNYAAHGTLTPAYLQRGETDEENWYIYTYERNGRTLESYWMHPSGIDQGESSAATYALHILVGHHGVFSLTPIWLLSLAGIVMSLAGWRGKEYRLLQAAIAVMTLVCLAFFLTRALQFRNYGGMTSGFRWMFWFAPLWLAAMLPALDAMARSKAWRCVALVLLLLSCLSVTYPTWNPWTHPWLMDFMLQMEWVKLP